MKRKQSYQMSVCVRDTSISIDQHLEEQSDSRQSKSKRKVQVKDEPSNSLHQTPRRSIYKRIGSQKKITAITNFISREQVSEASFTKDKNVSSKQEFKIKRIGTLKKILAFICNEGEKVQAPPISKTEEKKRQSVKAKDIICSQLGSESEESKVLLRRENNDVPQNVEIIVSMVSDELTLNGRSNKKEEENQCRHRISARDSEVRKLPINISQDHIGSDVLLTTERSRNDKNSINEDILDENMGSNFLRPFEEDDNEKKKSFISNYTLSVKANTCPEHSSQRLGDSNLDIDCDKSNRGDTDEKKEKITLKKSYIEEPNSERQIQELQNLQGKSKFSIAFKPLIEKTNSFMNHSVPLKPGSKEVRPLIKMGHSNNLHNKQSKQTPEVKVQKRTKNLENVSIHEYISEARKEVSS